MIGGKHDFRCALQVLKAVEEFVQSNEAEYEPSHNIKTNEGTATIVIQEVYFHCQPQEIQSLGDETTTIPDPENELEIRMTVLHESSNRVTPLDNLGKPKAIVEDLDDYDDVTLGDSNVIYSSEGSSSVRFTVHDERTINSIISGTFEAYNSEQPMGVPKLY